MGGVGGGRPHSGGGWAGGLEPRFSISSWVFRIAHVEGTLDGSCLSVFTAVWEAVEWLNHLVLLMGTRVAVGLPMHQSLEHACPPKTCCYSEAVEPLGGVESP